MNRGSRTAAPDTVTVTYPTSAATNQLESPAAIYDKTGRLTSYSNTLYAWDVLDQMTKVDGTAAGSEAWIHVYNSAGERVWSWRTSASRQDTYTLRDPGGKVLTLFNKLPGTPNPTYTWEDYVYREGQLLAAKMSDGAVKHFDLDHLGSVRLETDANGAVLAYRDFWPYGEETATPTATERMKFTGHERDLGVLGSNVDDLDYMHARYYRPLVGRFLSVDPASGLLKMPLTMNRYIYALDNPLRLVDPNGEAPEEAGLYDRLRGWALQKLTSIFPPQRVPDDDSNAEAAREADTSPSLLPKNLAAQFQAGLLDASSTLGAGGAFLGIKSGELFFAAETINGFRVGFSALLGRGTLEVNVFALKTMGSGRNLRGLLRTFERGAAEAGAKELVVRGTLSDALFQTAEAKAIAEKLGYTFQVLKNGSVILRKTI